MKILGGFAVINDNSGKKVAFTYSEVDENGIILKSNQKGSYLILDNKELDIVKKLEDRIKEKLNNI